MSLVQNHDGQPWSVTFIIFHGMLKQKQTSQKDNDYLQGGSPDAHVFLESLDLGSGENNSENVRDVYT